MTKPNFIELPGCEPISIIFEGCSVLAIDKPHGAAGARLARTAKDGVAQRLKSG